MNRKDYVEWLNEVGTPRDDLTSEGGRVPDNAKYGEWVRKHDPIAFNVGFREFQQENHHDLQN